MKYLHQVEKYYVQIFSSNDEIKKKSSRFASIVIYARNKYGLIGVIIANLLLSLISILLITVLQVYLHNLISSV